MFVGNVYEWRFFDDRFIENPILAASYLKDALVDYEVISLIDSLADKLEFKPENALEISDERTLDALFSLLQFLNTKQRDVESAHLLPPEIFTLIEKLRDLQDPVLKKVVERNRINFPFSKIFMSKPSNYCIIEY